MGGDRDGPATGTGAVRCPASYFPEIFHGNLSYWKEDLEMGDPTPPNDSIEKPAEENSRRRSREADE